MLVSSPCKNLKSSFASSQMNATVWWATWQVDSLLGARGGSSEHEATRKTRNEFMAAWDGLRSKDNERVLVLAATNRPFDLDDAVVRRLPRRYYVLTNLPETILQESSSWIQM
jgi:SpoVK/Ycf46/Vps4 family AAA+-type ATPase